MTAASQHLRRLYADHVGPTCTAWRLGCRFQEPTKAINLNPQQSLLSNEVCYHNGTLVAPMCQKYIPSVASPIKVHTRSCLCPAIYLIVLGDAGQRPASSVRTTLVQRRGIPYPQACHALLTRFAWILSEPACLSSEWYSAHMPISNPAQGRSARFGSTWSGGEVELVILTNSGMEAT